MLKSRSSSLGRVSWLSSQGQGSFAAVARDASHAVSRLAARALPSGGSSRLWPVRRRSVVQRASDRVREAGSVSWSVASRRVDVPVWALVSGVTVVGVCVAGVPLWCRRRRANSVSLSQVQSMYESASSILQAASHETSTPIAVIDGYCELLTDGTLGSLTAAQADAVRAVASASHRLRLVAGTVLFLAGVDAGAVRMYAEDVDAHEFASAAARDYRVAHPDHEVLVVADLPRVWADPHALRLMVDNLVSNAVKASVPGSRVTVRLAEEGTGWSLTVSDEGHGIPPEDIGRIFDRYARGSVSQDLGVPGTGLGLSVVSDLAAAHSAGVTVSSELGVGTVFTVDFPWPAPHPLSRPVSSPL